MIASYAFSIATSLLSSWYDGPERPNSSALAENVVGFTRDGSERQDEAQRARVHPRIKRLSLDLGPGRAGKRIEPLPIASPRKATSPNPLPPVRDRSERSDADRERCCLSSGLSQAQPHPEEDVEGRPDKNRDPGGIVKQSIRVVTLAVEDLKRSRAFYSEGLRWTPLMDLDEIVFYQAGFGLIFAIWTLRDLSNDVGSPLSAGSAFSLGHNVDSREEVNSVIERARAAGATILKEPQDAPLFGGYQAYFADPDGHLWDIVYNPGLSVAEDGTVIFSSPEDR
jgi:uncharacterized protein